MISMHQENRSRDKELFSLLLSMCLVAAIGLVATFGLSACGQGNEATPEESSEPAADDSAEATPEEEPSEPATEPEPAGAAYGYAGDDPVELAVYQHMVDTVAKDYDAADASIPIVQIVSVDDTNPDEVVVYGDFWIDNYDIEGDTLVCASGGNYPGVMHLRKDGDRYTVSSFDVVADGSDFDASAHELFGDHYDAFMAVYGDDAARAELRTATVSNYVNMNNLEVTQYQDFGWDPVPLS